MRSWSRRKHFPARTTDPHVSVLLVTHGGLSHIFRFFKSFALTRFPGELDCEVVVVDNASNWLVTSFLRGLRFFRFIDKLSLLPTNLYFSPGVNLAAKTAGRKSKYFLLANSDLVFLSENLLTKMMSIHKRGITGFGHIIATPEYPERCDGYFFLVDTDVFWALGGLNERFEWFWSITQIEALALRAGLSVQAVVNGNQHLRHVGGGSGVPPLHARGMDVSAEEVRSWFGNESITLVNLPSAD
jgi:hypothetical protein